jgi:hypothetical protein
MDAALKQNINLKIEVQSRGMEIKRLKKLLLELQRELERWVICFRYSCLG